MVILINLSKARIILLYHILFFSISPCVCIPGTLLILDNIDRVLQALSICSSMFLRPSIRLCSCVVIVSNERKNQSVQSMNNTMYVIYYHGCQAIFYVGRYTINLASLLILYAGKLVYVCILFKNDHFLFQECYLVQSKYRQKKVNLSGTKSFIRGLFYKTISFLIFFKNVYRTHFQADR